MLFAKLAVGEISPMQLILFRWVAVVIMILPFVWVGIREHWAVIRQNIWYIGAMGALGFSTFNALYYTAAEHTTGINLGIIQGTMPILVLGGSLILFGTRLVPLQVTGALVTLTGAILVAIQGELQRLLTFQFNVGDLMVFVACVLYAGYTLWLKNRPDIPALVWFSVLAIAAMLAAVPMAITEITFSDVQWPTTRGWVIVALVALFPSFIAQFCFIRGVELIGPERAGVFVNLVPVLAPLAAVAILGETLQWFHIAGLVLVLGGVWLAERFGR